LAIALHKTALTMLLGTTFRVVQAAVAEQVFPLGKQGSLAMGLMFAAAGVGTGIGPVATRWLTGDNPTRLRWAMLAGYLVGGVGVAVSAPLTSLPVMLAGSLLAGMGNGILWVFSTQLLLQQVDAAIRGRVFGTEFAMFALASAAGSATVGVAIDTRWGLTGVMTAMAGLSLLPAAAWTLWLLSRRSANG
jgi:MFS family permease